MSLPPRGPIAPCSFAPCFAFLCTLQPLLDVSNVIVYWATSNEYNYWYETSEWATEPAAPAAATVAGRWRWQRGSFCNFLFMRWMGHAKLSRSLVVDDTKLLCRWRSTSSDKKWWGIVVVVVVDDELVIYVICCCSLFFSILNWIELMGRFTTLTAFSPCIHPAPHVGSSFNIDWARNVGNIISTKKLITFCCFYEPQLGLNGNSSKQASMGVRSCCCECRGTSNSTTRTAV